MTTLQDRAHDKAAEAHYGCARNCDGGRLACPVPSACHVSEPAEDDDEVTPLFRALVLAALWLVAAALAFGLAMSF